MVIVVLKRVIKVPYVVRKQMWFKGIIPNSFMHMQLFIITRAYDCSVQLFTS